MRLDIAYNWRKVLLLLCKAIRMNQKKNDLPPKRLPVAASLEIIAALGGSAAVAQECGIRTASVSEWKTQGIPRAWALFLRESYRNLPVMKSTEVRNF